MVAKNVFNQNDNGSDFIISAVNRISVPIAAAFDWNRFKNGNLVKVVNTFFRRFGYAKMLKNKNKQKMLNTPYPVQKRLLAVTDSAILAGNKVAVVVKISNKGMSRT